MLLNRMTWEEVARTDREIVAIVPFGALEQHSFHLPMGTDSILIDAVARRLEKQIPDQVCVLPVTWLGCSRHHMDFAGSLTATVDTFLAVGEEIVSSMAEHGFRRFILLNGHGGNVNKISLMAENLSYQHGAKLKVIGITYWHLITEEIKAIRETPLGGMGHACELETSLLLASHPELVRLGRMEADGHFCDSEFDRKDMFAPGAVTVTRQFKDLSRHGGIGDPTSASREKGERIFDAVVGKLRQVVEEIQAGVL
jgi:creatinine amidohydrolase